jgi:hypothetical protein
MYGRSHSRPKLMLGRVRRQRPGGHNRPAGLYAGRPVIQHTFGLETFQQKLLGNNYGGVTERERLRIRPPGHYALPDSRQVMKQIFPAESVFEKRLSTLAQHDRGQSGPTRSFQYDLKTGRAKEVRTPRGGDPATADNGAGHAGAL